MINLQINRALLSGIDKRLMLYTLLLLLVGLLVLYSATRTQTSENLHGQFRKQCVWVLITSVALLISMAIPYRDWERYAYLAYAGSLALLILLPWLPSVHEAGGASRWLRLGPASLQPSEVAKICLILGLARALDLPEEKKGSWRMCAIAVGITLVPMALVLKQPDLGTALCFCAPLGAMLWANGAKIKHLLALGISGLSAVPLAYFLLLKDYQRSRILTFLFPARDPLGSGWNVLQSKIAIGSGGLWGKGWLANTQGQLQFLPRHHTDFIFSVLAEEQGFVGTLIVLLLLWLWTSRCLGRSRDGRDTFGRLLVVGIASLFAFQTLVNVLMTTGLLPCTGLPLPFLSYGGSNLLMVMWGVGMIQNVYMRRYMFT